MIAESPLFFFFLEGDEQKALHVILIIANKNSEPSWAS